MDNDLIYTRLHGTKIDILVKIFFDKAFRNWDFFSSLIFRNDKSKFESTRARVFSLV